MDSSQTIKDFVKNIVSNSFIKEYGQKEYDTTEFRIDSMCEEIADKLGSAFYDSKEEYLNEYEGEDKFYIFGKNLLEQFESKILAKLERESFDNIPEDVCPYCGKKLTEMGVCREYLEVTDTDYNSKNQDYGDVVYYYCPECGRKLPYNMGDKFFKAY